MANVTCIPKAFFKMGKAAVVKKFEIHRQSVANAMALLLILLGKISDNNTQVTGPSVAA